MINKTVTLDLNSEHLNILAIAMDRLSCEIPVGHALATSVGALMVFFNDLADEVDAEEEEPLDRLVSQNDNVITVDFTPKAG